MRNSQNKKVQKVGRSVRSKLSALLFVTLFAGIGLYTLLPTHAAIIPIDSGGDQVDVYINSNMPEDKPWGSTFTFHVEAGITIKQGGPYYYTATLDMYDSNEPINITGLSGAPPLQVQAANHKQYGIGCTTLANTRLPASFNMTITNYRANYNVRLTVQYFSNSGCGGDGLGTTSRILGPTTVPSDPGGGGGPPAGGGGGGPPAGDGGQGEDGEGNGDGGEGQGTDGDGQGQGQGTGNNGNTPNGSGGTSTPSKTGNTAKNTSNTKAAGGSTKQTDKKGSAPSSTSQGGKQTPNKIDPSPFYDGKQYQPGSARDKGIKGVFNKAGRNIVKLLPYIAGVLLLTGFGIWWWVRRRHASRIP